MLKIYQRMAECKSKKSLDPFFRNPDFIAFSDILPNIQVLKPLNV
jgi:hypothetical protein